MTGPQVLIRACGLGLRVERPVPTRILHPTDITIDRAESVAVVGPSGAGKSTLASLLGALQPASEGTYHFDGQPVHEMRGTAVSAFRARHIGFVFQAANLIDERSAWRNVALGLVDGAIGSAERKRRSYEALDTVGMVELAEREASLLSGGERQRVAIARALVKRPSLVIADEPTGALDQATGDVVLRLIYGMSAAGAAVVVVTHDARAMDLAERSIQIVDGRQVPPW